MLSEKIALFLRDIINGKKTTDQVATTISKYFFKPSGHVVDQNDILDRACLILRKSLRPGIIRRESVFQEY
jgi:hypothetical protein